VIEIISPAGFEHFVQEFVDLVAAGPPAFDTVAARGRPALVWSSARPSDCPTSSPATG
jgi:hypothetical protein